MLESFMEDLLWRFPDDFFVRRGHKFTQAVRQFTLSDGGRLDISFRDASERLWVIEVKAVPLRIGIADQVYRYAQQLRESRPNEILFPAVVAPVINSVVEEQLIRWSIEPFQISEAEFRRVADERGIAMKQPPAVVAEPKATPTAAPTGASLRAMGIEELLALRDRTQRADLKLHYKIRVALRAHGYYISKNR
jgi:hypothetical protein